MKDVYQEAIKRINDEFSVSLEDALDRLGLTDEDYKEILRLSEVE